MRVKTNTFVPKIYINPKNGTRNWYNIYHILSYYKGNNDNLVSNSFVTFESTCSVFSKPIQNKFLVNKTRRRWSSGLVVWVHTTEGSAECVFSFLVCEENIFTSVFFYFLVSYNTLETILILVSLKLISNKLAWKRVSYSLYYK